MVSVIRVGEVRFGCLRKLENQFVVSQLDDLWQRRRDSRFTMQLRKLGPTLQLWTRTEWYVQHDCSEQYVETVEFLQSRIERSFHQVGVVSSCDPQCSEARGRAPSQPAAPDQIFDKWTQLWYYFKWAFYWAPFLQFRNWAPQLQASPLPTPPSQMEHQIHRSNI